MIKITSEFASTFYKDFPLQFKYIQPFNISGQLTHY